MTGIKKRFAAIGALALLLALIWMVAGLCGRGMPFREKFDLEGSSERVTLFYYHGMKRIGTVELKGQTLRQWRRELDSWRVREAGEADKPLSGIGGPSVIARVEYPTATLDLYFENDDGLIEAAADSLSRHSCVVVNWRIATRENVIALCGGEP